MTQDDREAAAAEEVRAEGACAPFEILSEAECAEVVAEAKRVLPECHWKKSLHEKGEKCRAIAADEHITGIVKKALGTDDIIVWGTYLVEKAAGQNHRWHADCEVRLLGMRGARRFVPLAMTALQRSRRCSAGQCANTHSLAHILPHAVAAMGDDQRMDPADQRRRGVVHELHTPFPQVPHAVSGRGPKRALGV